MDTLFATLGWIGMILIVTAFVLKDHPRKAVVALMNIVGATLLGASLVHKEAWAGVALEVVWVAVALKDLVRAGKGPRQIP
jgi:hypothetical protein